VSVLSRLSSSPRPPLRPCWLKPLAPQPPRYCAGVTLDAKRLERTWAADLRGRYYEEDEAMRKANLAAAAAGEGPL
jgi:hypothetical protein